MKKISINELKNIQLEILKHVDKFCSEHNIKYFLSGGSVIGAVRHKGFIPWDDDIDIMMLREDYNFFVQEYYKHDNSRYCLYCHTIYSDYPYPFAKIDDSKTVMQEEIEGCYPMGVHIDVFPIDNMPEDKQLQKKIYRIFSFWMALMNLKRLPVLRRRGIVKNLILFIAHIFLYFLSFKKIVRCMDANARKYEKIETSLCGVAVWGYGIKEINNKNNYEKSILVEFEGIKLPIPIGYDNYLSNVYGNYMQLPPIEKRNSHHNFIAYWK